MSKAKTLASAVSTGGALANPTAIPAANIAGLATVATSGSYTDLSDKPSDVVTSTGTQTLTNKTLTTPVIQQNVQVIATNTTAVASRTYVLTAALTLTLPASPAAGDWVAVQNSSGLTTPVISRNGSNILSLAEDLVINAINVSITLVYADATLGWVFG